MLVFHLFLYVVEAKIAKPEGRTNRTKAHIQSQLCDMLSPGAHTVITRSQPMLSQRTSSRHMCRLRMWNRLMFHLGMFLQPTLLLSMFHQHTLHPSMWRQSLINMSRRLTWLQNRATAHTTPTSQVDLFTCQGTNLVALPATSLTRATPLRIIFQITIRRPTTQPLTVKRPRVTSPRARRLPRKRLYARSN